MCVREDDNDIGKTRAGGLRWKKERKNKKARLDGEIKSEKDHKHAKTWRTQTQHKRRPQGEIF